MSWWSWVGPGALDGDDKPTCDTSRWTSPQKESQTQFTLQLGISFSLAIVSYLAFCSLRPRWKALYAARTRFLNASLGIPELPDSFFGWILPVYRITDMQVLKASGLDALGFLSFFRMASKIIGIMFWFSLAILLPVYLSYDETGKAGMRYILEFEDTTSDETRDESYLWAISVFTWFFTFVTLKVMREETTKFIDTRHNYLATQGLVSTRTLLFSGIPKALRSMQAMKEWLEQFPVGKVTEVSIVRVWHDLDSLLKERDVVKRKLERVWASYLQAKPRSAPSPSTSPNGGNGELGQSLLANSDGRKRPTIWLWSWSKFWFRSVDAIDHYQEQLQLLDERIMAERQMEHKAVDRAFVTMDSILACQLVGGVVVNHRPGVMETKPAPSPTDIDWENTYSPRSTRYLRMLLVTLTVLVLTVVWVVPVGVIASFASICTIKTTLPSFYDFLKLHQIIRAWVQTGLPTIAVTALNAGVPYINEYLSYHQGMISKADVEMSIIIKNFLFIFFNVFLVFTIFGTVGSIADVIRDSFKDTTYLASKLAKEIVKLGDFYMNLIMLNAIGILPFRLLQFGSVFLTPFYKLFAKTPRERAELLKPDLFSLGFHLPIAMFIFILSLVYSVLPGGYWILAFGWIYFVHGHFTYKYQLVYALDQSQHADGKAWILICYCMQLGLIVFALTMSGFLALRKAYFPALSIVPVLAVVLWFMWHYKREYEPRTQSISLQAIRDARFDDDAANAILEDDDLEAFSGPRQGAQARRGSTFDEDREQGLRYVNPSLVVRLDQPWIYQDPPPPLSDSASEAGSGRATDVGNLIDHINDGDLDDQEELDNHYRYTDEIPNDEDRYRIPTRGPRQLTPGRTQQQQSGSQQGGGAPARTNSSSSVNLDLATPHEDRLSATAAAQALAMPIDETPSRPRRRRERVVGTAMTEAGSSTQTRDDRLNASSSSLPQTPIQRRDQDEPSPFFRRLMELGPMEVIGLGTQNML